MKRIFMLAAVVWAGAAMTAGAQWTAEAEGGRAWAEYIDVRIPGDTGTKFSLTDDLSADHTSYFRGRLGYRFGPRHRLVLEAAPLEIESDGAADKDISFDGETFAAGTPLDASFRFDTYRLAYRYDVRTNASFQAAVGATLLVRDAAIRVAGGGRSAEDSNLGLVPLFGFDVDWRLSKRLFLSVDGNALAAPQGRAEDVFAGLQFRVADKVDLSAGYRLVEGGADNDSVYTFALIHHVALGITARF